MSTSDIRIGRKNIVSYIGISLFCILFTVIYEHFSYGEYSWYMRGMFLYPLLGGAGASLIFFKKNVNCWSVRLWNSAVAVLTCGCLIHGIIAISGRSSEYDWCYYAAGAVFAVSAVISYVRSKLRAGKSFCE